VVYRGRVQNGRIELDDPVQLPEGASVEVQVSDDTPHSGTTENGPTLFEQLEGIIGAVPDLPDDLSVNHDHYLYGVPKRE
jgi:hypothetical protein